MFNMNVFCILFFVLINTIGNQGDPNHGLTNVDNEQESIPPYILIIPVKSNFEKLRLPEPNIKVPDYVDVLGWVWDSEEKKMVIKRPAVMFDDRFIGWNDEKLRKLGVGSPIIAGGVIYGFLENCTRGFVYVDDELEWIKRMAHINSTHN